MLQTLPKEQLPSHRTFSFYPRNQIIVSEKYNNKTLYKISTMQCHEIGERIIWLKDMDYVNICVFSIITMKQIGK